MHVKLEIFECTETYWTAFRAKIYASYFISRYSLHIRELTIQQAYSLTYDPEKEASPPDPSALLGIFLRS